MIKSPGYKGIYDLRCSGCTFDERRSRVYGRGCVYENDKIYILFDDGTRTEIIPETLSVDVQKKTEHFLTSPQGPHYIFEKIGPVYIEHR